VTYLATRVVPGISATGKRGRRYVELYFELIKTVGY